MKFIILEYIIMYYCTIFDSITAACIGGVSIVPALGQLQLRLFRPDMLFVESAWKGWCSSWKFKIAAYPDHPERTNHALLRLLEYARKRHIPTVFWDKEGMTHFDRFIDSARHFDHVFTVDADTVPQYKAIMGENASIHVLPFAVNRHFHFFDGFRFKENTANFVGSYCTHIHPRRREWQEMFFRTALSSGLGLHVVDRNSGHKSAIYRYPALDGLHIHPAVSNEQTAKIYKHYLVSLNVNTNEKSSTMVSRRLVEVLACGGIAVTTPSPAVEKEFSCFCHIVHSREEAEELFARLKYGPSADDLDKARAAADYIAHHHTWNHRLKYISEVVCSSI